MFVYVASFLHLKASYTFLRLIRPEGRDLVVYFDTKLRPSKHTYTSSMSKTM